MTTSRIVTLTRVRWLSVIDAITYVALVGVAMPLKYAADMPMAVRVVGMIHGVVWMLFMCQLMRARFEADWPSSRVWLLSIAALLPVVPFFLDRSIKNWIAST